MTTSLSFVSPHRDTSALSAPDPIFRRPVTNVKSVSPVPHGLTVSFLSTDEVTAIEAAQWDCLAAWSDFFAQPLWWIIGREHSDSFTIDDPIPGIAGIWDVLKRVARLAPAARDGRLGDRLSALAIHEPIVPAGR